jgi:hypothetical protein
MEIESKSANARLNALVAITVLIIAVFMAVAKLKDDNLVRDMAFVKADSVDTWNQFQAEHIKLHLDENSAAELNMNGGWDVNALHDEQQRLSQEITKYTNESAQLFVKAQGEDNRYRDLEFHHDQFDLSDGLLSIAMALTAVAALADVYWLIVAAWAFAACGMIMGLAGFAGLPFHPDFIMRFLG